MSPSRMRLAGELSAFTWELIGRTFWRSIV